MQDNKNLEVSKSAKGGSNIHCCVFCYFHIPLDEGDKFIEEYNVKFSSESPLLHEFTHFRWHGYNKPSNSYIAFLEFASKNKAIIVFSKSPITFFSSEPILLNMILSGEDSQDKLSLITIHLSYGHVDRGAKFLTTMIYQGLDLIEGILPPESSKAELLIYQSMYSLDIMDVLNEHYDSEKIADCTEVDMVVRAIIFALRLDLGYRDDVEDKRYYPVHMSYGDLQHIAGNYNLGNDFNIHELASIYGKYCKNRPYKEHLNYKEYILYAPEPYFLIAILRSRVYWV